MSETFVWNFMDFKIDYLNDGSVITLLGQSNRIIMHGLPKDLNISDARLLVQGYSDGLEYGAYRVVCAAQSAQQNYSLRRLFHRGENE